MIKPRTLSPRNSRRSFVGKPPNSYANERWVSARLRSSGLTETPSFSVKASVRIRPLELDGGYKCRMLDMLCAATLAVGIGYK